jgi:hypothetical protein
VGFVIAHYFAVSDFLVFWDFCKFDKETCVGSRNVPNALKKALDFIPKWLQTGVFHKGHVFHFFSGDWMNDCIGLLLLGPMGIPRVITMWSVSMPQKSSWDKLLGARCCERCGTLGSED